MLSICFWYLSIYHEFVLRKVLRKWHTERTINTNDSLIHFLSSDLIFYLSWTVFKPSCIQFKPVICINESKWSENLTYKPYAVTVKRCMVFISIETINWVNKHCDSSSRSMNKKLIKVSFIDFLFISQCEYKCSFFFSWIVLLNNKNTI